MPNLALRVLVSAGAVHQCFGFHRSPAPAQLTSFPRNSQSHQSSVPILQHVVTRYYSNNPNNEGAEDWRDFRAKLVMQFRDEDDDSSSSSTSSSSSSFDQTLLDGSWAYESGDAIEKGSIILACPEQDFGYGLRQQYFHKCLVLVIYHEELAFTKGIVLNRPTDLVLGDDDFVNSDGTPLDDADPDSQWKIWFGGEVRGFDSPDPEQCCLHSLTSDAALEVSERVLKNISWTTMTGARKLVRDGHAKAEDFLVFCGYAGWNAGQLVDEINRKSWYMLQTDDKTLLKEIQKTDDAKDPQRVGLGTWNMLMDVIGKGEEAKCSEGVFDDLMLREWAKQRLVFHGNTDATKSVEDEVSAISERAERIGNLSPGTIIRAASSADTRNGQPFLLEDQEFLQSVIMIIQDDEHITVGVILNVPSAYKIDVKLNEQGSSDGKRKSQVKPEIISIPQRYGGKFGLKGQTEKPTVWLHNCEELKDAKVGQPLGGDESNRVWICTQEDSEFALGIPGLVDEADFMVINGFTVWEKSKEEGVIGGLMGEMLAGTFEVVPNEKTDEIWAILETQNELLNADNIDANLSAAQAAWVCAGGTCNSSSDSASLADKARNSWWCTFLLGDPKLRFS